MAEIDNKERPAALQAEEIFVSAELTSSFTEPRHAMTPRPESLQLEIGMSGELEATLTTERLTMKSITREDFQDYYTELLGNAEVIEKFADGEPRDAKRVLKAVDMWVDRWQEGNPMSALAIRTKEGEFVGHIVAGNGDNPGQSEVAYLIKKEFWGDGVGKEAALAVMNHFVPLLKAFGYETKGAPLHELQATSRTDNPASEAILRRAGLVVERIGEKFGHERFHFVGPIKMPDPSAVLEVSTSVAGTTIEEKY